MKDYLFFTIVIFILAWTYTNLSIGVILWALGGASIMSMIICKQLKVIKEMEEYHKKLEEELK